MTYHEALEDVLDKAGNLTRFHMADQLSRAVRASSAFFELFNELRTAVQAAEMTPNEADALVDAAQTVIHDMEESHDDAPWMEPLRAAVAKATGVEVNS